jgi:hypothetical protein
MSVPHGLGAVPASTGGVSPQTPPRGTQTLACWPVTVLTGVHARSALHSLPPGHEGAQ